MTTEEILDVISEEEGELLLADGFEDAIIGMVSRACRLSVVCYDYGKCVEILMTRDGMSQDEAEEFLDFNTLGADVGEGTPVFLHNLRDRTI